MDDLLWNTVRCPTCGARQEWSDTCRRCKCDLRLLRDLAAAYRGSRRRFLRDLRAGRIADAIHAARRCRRLRDDEASRRLLALGTLLQGDWAAASVLARRALEAER